MDIDGLIRVASEARRHAYAPYSLFSVGAAVLAASGAVFTGANVENASYGLTICAERAAVFAAASAGERRIRAVAIVAEARDPVPPCGACRQVLVEFGPEVLVVSRMGIRASNLGAGRPAAPRFCRHSTQGPPTLRRSS